MDKKTHWSTRMLASVIVTTPALMMLARGSLSPSISVCSDGGEETGGAVWMRSSRSLYSPVAGGALPVWPLSTVAEKRSSPISVWASKASASLTVEWCNLWDMLEGRLDSEDDCGGGKQSVLWTFCGAAGRTALPSG